MFDIVGIESPCMDFAVNLNRLPEPNKGSRLNDYTWQGGGKISTGMIAAARLGARCMQIGTLGDDLFGRSFYRDFIRHGVDVSRMEILEGTTSLSVVLSDRETKGRSIMYKSGTVPRVGDDIDIEPVLTAKYFFLAHLGGVNLRAAKAARENGVKVFMDADHPHAGMMENIGLVDAFVASEFVLNDLFPSKTGAPVDEVSGSGASPEEPADGYYKAACETIRAMGPDVVVFTLGSKGCAGMDGNGFFKLDTYDVEVVDTLGAGDVYHGAFLAGLLRGWDAKKTADFSNAVSSIKVTRAGGRAGIPDFDTVIRFMQTGVIDYTDIDKRVEYYKRGLEHV